ncbi:MAG: ABC transporter permease, partial [Selenomonadaceae bacterium]|nr:ABC transporter permease [Selenomonadaceae bacterium]
MLTKFFELIGAFMIRRFEEFGTIILLYVDTMKQLTHKPRMRHIVAQMSHLGVDSLTIVSLTLLFT